MLCFLKQVLGVTPEADSNEINRAYTRKKYENRGNTAMTQKIEAAHSQLMLSAFTNRMKVRWCCEQVI